MIILIKGIPRCSASGWDNKKCVIARLDRAIQRLDLWIPRSSRRMTIDSKQNIIKDIVCRFFKTTCLKEEKVNE